MVGFFLVLKAMFAIKSWIPSSFLLYSFILKILCVHAASLVCVPGESGVGPPFLDYGAYGRAISLPYIGRVWVVCLLT